MPWESFPRNPDGKGPVSPVRLSAASPLPGDLPGEGQSSAPKWSSCCSQQDSEREPPACCSSAPLSHKEARIPKVDPELLWMVNVYGLEGPGPAWFQVIHVS